MSFDNFRAAVDPKVKGSWNLHTLLPRGMNFFVLLSSVTGVFGGQCQANYACGNTYQDGLARHRVSNGEKAVSLDLGLMSSVGFAAEHQTIFDSLQSKGLIPISEPEFHAMLDYYCNPLLDNASVLKSQVLTGLSTPGTRDKKFEEPYWATRPLFRHLLHMNDGMSDSDNNTTTEQEAQTDFKALLRSAQSFGNAAIIAHKAIIWKLSRALLIPLEDIDAHKPMHSYGVDSLVAVELRNWLLSALSADVAVFDILGSGSIADLGLMVARKSDCVSFTGGEN